MVAAREKFETLGRVNHSTRFGEHTVKLALFPGFQGRYDNGVGMPRSSLCPCISLGDRIYGHNRNRSQSP